MLPYLFDILQRFWCDIEGEGFTAGTVFLVLYTKNNKGLFS